MSSSQRRLYSKGRSISPPDTSRSDRYHSSTSTKLPTSKIPQRSASAPRSRPPIGIPVPASRSSQVARDALLSEFSSRYGKIRQQLHERTSQCNNLAQELDKCKNILKQEHETFLLLQQDELDIKHKFEEAQTIYTLEQENTRNLAHELTHLRKEKQDRIRFKQIASQEHASSSQVYKQVLEEHQRLEGIARQLSQKLQQANKERLEYKQQYLENQHQINQYNSQLDVLRGEFQSMKDVIYTSIGESLLK
eukprot:TRINITY_DN5837_c1_g1_i1.p1 TRINITY_DN5837_c1_g1~~TRINITY_DN5837_c1_g1_i1.p1  ORF type:complete len:286 (-),score=49.05 TRINITY_DN5837_c1_g1_i1:86-835(-)